MSTHTFSRRRLAAAFVRSQGGPIDINVEHVARGEWVVTITDKAQEPKGAPIKLAFANGNDIKVHAAGCADLSKAPTKSAAYNGIHTQTFDAGTDERDVWVDFNEDFLNEGGADAAWPLEFLPCCHAAGLAKNSDRTWED